MPTATLSDPASAETALETNVELLIREARRRARRRRATLAALVGAVVLVLGGAFGVLASRPADKAAPIPESALPVEGAAAAGTPVVETELAAALWLHTGGLWLYLYDDGRLIRSGAGGWQEQRLTQQGVATVLAMIEQSGIFDAPPQLRSPTDQGCCGLLQFRRDGELVSVPHSLQPPDQAAAGDFTGRYRATDSFDRVANRLLSLSAWLPEDHWVDASISDYQPANHVVCAWAGESTRLQPPGEALHDLLDLLPPDAAGIFRTAAPPAPIPPDVDENWNDGFLPERELCRVMPTAHAEMLALALGVPAAAFTTHVGISPPLDARVGSFQVWFIPVLPHGVPGMTPG